MSGPLLIILLTTFLNIAGFGVILPVLPFYGTEYGASGTHVGLLFTTYGALQFLTAPVYGALSDRFGRRPIVLLGIVGQVAGYLIMGFATNLEMLYLSRVVAGVTAGNVAAAGAYVADITPPQGRTRAFGLMGAAFGVGFVFGPVLGGVLFPLDARAPAFGAAALLALNFLVGVAMLPESLAREHRSHRPLGSQLNPFATLVPLLRRPALRGPLAATFLLNVAVTGFQTNFPLFAGQQYAVSPSEIFYLFVAMSLANIAVQGLLVPKLTGRMSDDAMVLTGATANAAGYVATGFAPVSAVFWASSPALSGGYSLTRGPLTSLTTKLVGPKEQGMVNGAIQAAISFAWVVGPLSAGAAYESGVTSSPYWAGAMFVGVAAAAVALRARPAPAPSPPVAPAPTSGAAGERLPAPRMVPAPTSGVGERLPAPRLAPAPTSGAVGEDIDQLLSVVEGAAENVLMRAREEAATIREAAAARAQQLVRDAERTWAEADAYSHDTRAAVDAYAAARRRDAEQQARAVLAEAEARAGVRREAAEEMVRRLENEARTWRGELLEKVRTVETRMQQGARGLREIASELEELRRAERAAREEALEEALKVQRRRVSPGPPVFPPALPPS